MENNESVVQTMSAMSYNVLYNIENGIPNRADKVVEMVLKYMPDSVGFQEVTWEWLLILTERLKEYYNCAPGQSLAGGLVGSQYRPIFFRRDKYRIVTSGTRWLSDTPDIVSRYPDSSQYRTLTYAVLRRHSDGKIFVHVNTHMENGPGPKQAKVLVDFMKNFKDYPVCVTGDFNNQPDTETFRVLTSENLRASYEVADQVYAGNTLHCWGRFDILIDFAFVDPQNMHTTLYKVCTDKIDGEYPSDHHPVYIEFQF